jgi:hypothetical protein
VQQRLQSEAQLQSFITAPTKQASGIRCHAHVKVINKVMRKVGCLPE